MHIGIMMHLADECVYVSARITSKLSHLLSAW